jgi:hypothetical protein
MEVFYVLIIILVLILLYLTFGYFVLWTNSTGKLQMPLLTR